MQRAGRLIGKLKPLGDLADPEARARAAWNVAAGKNIARHTRATALVRGTLVIEVEDQLWQRQLLTLRKPLIENLANILGEASVIDLDFRPTPRRRMPQRAEAARPNAEGIEDPVMGMLYQQSRKRELA